MIQIFKVWIRKSGFANLPVWIRKDSFRAIVLRIRQDSWGFVVFMKTGRIFKNRTHESGFANLWSRICQSRNETNLFGVRIRDYDTKRIHGFAKRIHVFTNLLYDSRILNCNIKMLLKIQIPVEWVLWWQFRLHILKFACLKPLIFLSL